MNHPLEPLFIREAADVYHANAAHFLSSHALRDYFKCPLQYRRKIGGLAVEKVTAFYELGRAAHVLIAEGPEAFAAEYVIGGPINPATGNCYGKDTKKFKAWADEQVKPVIEDGDYALLCNMATAVKSHEAAGPLFTGGICEGVIRAEYCGILCQVRGDYFKFSADTLVDLKTCENLDNFVTDAFDYGYPEQLAFYREVMRAAHEDKQSGRRIQDARQVVTKVTLVAVEKREPYRVGVWYLTDKLLSEKAAANVHAIDCLKLSRQFDDWPTNYEEPRTLCVEGEQ